jgi:hypothetical protein
MVYNIYHSLCTAAYINDIYHSILNGIYVLVYHGIYHIISCSFILHNIHDLNSSGTLHCLQQENARNLLQIEWDHITFQGIEIFFTANHNLSTCTVSEDALMLCLFKSGQQKDWNKISCCPSFDLLSCNIYKHYINTTRPTNFNSRIGNKKKSFVWQEYLFKNISTENVSPLCSPPSNSSRIDAQSWSQSRKMLCQGNKMKLLGKECVICPWEGR